MTETKPANLPTVSELVQMDYRAADVLRKWGINYCCGGRLPLAEACAVKGLDARVVQQELDAAAKSILLPAGLAFNTWPIDFLVDYIVHVHHAYLKQVLPALHQHLHSFVTGHIKKYPYLHQVEAVYHDLSAELTAHNRHEEERIFPYLKQVNHTFVRRETYGSLFVRNLGKPLEQEVSQDHKRIASLLEQLRAATNHYSFTEQACTNHQVIYKKLQELDNDLVQHKHLEYNILYPRVQQMEKELLEETPNA